MNKYFEYFFHVLRIIEQLLREYGIRQLLPSFKFLIRCMLFKISTMCDLQFSSCFLHNVSYWKDVVYAVYSFKATKRDD